MLHAEQTIDRFRKRKYKRPTDDLTELTEAV